MSTAAATCFSVLAAVERYPDWSGESIRAVTVLDRDPNGLPVRAHAVVHVAQSPFGKTFELDAAIRSEPPRAVHVSRPSTSSRSTRAASSSELSGVRPAIPSIICLRADDRAVAGGGRGRLDRNQRQAGLGSRVRGRLANVVYQPSVFGSLRSAVQPHGRCRSSCHRCTSSRRAVACESRCRASPLGPVRPSRRRPTSWSAKSWSSRWRSSSDRIAPTGPELRLDPVVREFVSELARIAARGDDIRDRLFGSRLIV